MAQFITLDTNGSEYQRYLRGEFSDSERALPIPLLENNTQSSQATFQIVPLAEIEAKPMARKLIELYRLDLVGFTILPVSAVSIWANTDRSWTRIFLFLAIMLFHGAIFAFNDYFDHMQGVDRMSEKRGTRLIQLGHFRALDVLRIAWVYWGLAMLAGLPVIIHNPKVLYYLAAGLFLGTVGSTYSKFGIKALSLNDLTSFLCMGPLLTASVAFAVAGRIEAQHVIVGIAFGLTATIYIQARHLSTAISDYRAGVQTLAVRLGFDRMKAVLILETALVFGVYAFLAGIHWSDELFSVFMSTLLVAGGFSAVVIKNLIEIRSPASSRAESLPGLISRRQFWLTAFLLILIK